VGTLPEVSRHFFFQSLLRGRDALQLIGVSFTRGHTRFFSFQRVRGRFSLILAHRLSEGVEMIEVLLDGVHGGEGLAALVLDVGWRDGRHAAPQETLRKGLNC
jgi:hypothetical protein